MVNVAAILTLLGIFWLSGNLFVLGIFWNLLVDITIYEISPFALAIIVLQGLNTLMSLYFFVIELEQINYG